MAPNSINREKNATLVEILPKSHSQARRHLIQCVFFSLHRANTFCYPTDTSKWNFLFTLQSDYNTKTTTKAQCMNAIQYAIHLLELKLLHKQFPRFPFSFVNLLKLCVQTQTLPLFARISLHSRIARAKNNSVYANKCCYYVSNWKVFEQLKLPFRLEWENSLSEVVRLHCIPLCQSVLYWFIQRFVWFTAIKGVSDIFHGFICLSSSGWEIVPMSIIG